MENYKRLEAVRWLVDETTMAGQELPEKIVVPNPTATTHIEILRETTNLIKYVTSLNRRVSDIFESKMEPDPNVVGRAVDISMPIQLSQGIIKTAALIEEAEENLKEYRETIEKLSEEASFGSDDLFEQLSRKRLALRDKIFDRTRLFLHSHLWLHWVIEGVDQAKQIRNLMEEHNRFEAAGTGAYAFFAFPPLAVATMSCTAVFEEVGAKYINQLTSKCKEPDETSFSDILATIENEYKRAEHFDIETIRETIGGARTDISHYMVARKDMVRIDSFDQYVSAIADSVWLIRYLVLDLIFDFIERFPGNLPKLTKEQISY